MKHERILFFLGNARVDILKLKKQLHRPKATLSKYNKHKKPTRNTTKLSKINQNAAKTATVVKTQHSPLKSTGF